MTNIFTFIASSQLTTSIHWPCYCIVHVTNIFTFIASSQLTTNIHWPCFCTVHVYVFILCCYNTWSCRLYRFCLYMYCRCRSSYQNGSPCNSNYSLKRVLIDCVDVSDIGQTFYNLTDLFTNVAAGDIILKVLKEIDFYNKSNKL